MAMRPPHATATDWYDFISQEVPDPVPTDVVQWMRRASRAVDEAIVTASYSVDESGMPDDDTVKADLAEATCIQHAYFLATGDPEGAGDYAGVDPMRIGPETVGFLRQRGYLNP
jgi:hypothetical protein